MAAHHRRSRTRVAHDEASTDRFSSAHGFRGLLRAKLEAPNLHDAPWSNVRVSIRAGFACWLAARRASRVEGRNHGAIDNNHGHTVVIPAADVATGTERTYSIQGTSRHPHMITVSAAQFSMLAAGMMVTVMSSRDSGHSHAITLVCG